MVLRKPYAFLIKHFKLLHIILTALISYSIYKTNLIIHFYNEYINSSQVIIGSNVQVSLFNFFIFFAPFLVILFAMILLAVMYNKKKPYIFYIILIIVNIISIAIYGITYSNILSMQNNIVNVRTASLIRDLLYINLILQTVIIVISTIRATGFDIKKFDFVRDLQDLKIEVKDNEEFEVDVNFDTDRFNRKLRRQLRYFRYVYLENQFVIHLILSLIFATSCFFIYFNLTIYQKTITQENAFPTNRFVIHVENVYVINKDYKGDKITDNYLVVVDTKIKTISQRHQLFDLESLDLKIGNHTFRHTTKYKDKIFDLGQTYLKQEINNKFTSYLFVFEIPSYLIKERMLFRYINEIDILGNNLQPKYIKVKLEPKYLDKVNSVNAYFDSDTSLNESVFKNASIKIDNYEINDNYKLEYDYCVNKDNCYKSYEYLVPSVLTNYDKTILKITGNFNLENSAIKNVYNLYDLIEKFGILEYEINGEVKTQDIAFKQIISKKASENEYYIEVLKEVKNADKINLKIKLRNREYVYNLK